jgi:hypothetical protein
LFILQPIADRMCDVCIRPVTASGGCE